jgi:hypothetical protein
MEKYEINTGFESKLFYNICGYYKLSCIYRLMKQVFFFCNKMEQIFIKDTFANTHFFYENKKLFVIN